MTLMVSFSSRISPLTSTVIFLERSPFCTAEVTSAMLRTWVVRLAASWLTLSVRSRQVPDAPRTYAWPPSRPSFPTSRATRVTSEAKALSWSTMPLIVFFRSRISPRTSTVIFFDRSPLATAEEDLAADVDGDLLRQVAVGDRGRDLGDVAHMRGEIAGHRVDVVGQVVPVARRAPHVGLAVQAAIGTGLARDAGDFGGEGVELIDHHVYGVLQLEDLALDFDRDLLGEVALLHGRCDLSDVTHLGRQLAGDLVDLVREVLPCPVLRRPTARSPDATLR